MECEGVLIACTIESYDIKLENGTMNASGIRFDNDWALVHGSILSLHKAAEKILKSDNASKSDYDRLPKICVSYADDSDIPELLPKICKKYGKIVYMWKCPLLEKSLDDLMQNWAFGRHHNTDKYDGVTERMFLSSFALVYIGDEKVNKKMFQNSLVRLYEMSSKRLPIRGEEIYLESTPFGNEIFLNSRTDGVVCNCIGAENCLVLCDASTSVCSEGGPAFLSDRNEVLGIILSSLSWWKGEWVGLTLLGCLAPSLHRLKFISNGNLYRDRMLTPKRMMLTNVLGKIDSLVVLVKCGGAWGSGISLGNDYFLTCSHVVENHLSGGVELYCKGARTEGKVIYKTPRNKAYDLALILAHFDDSTTVSEAKISFVPAIKGERVLAVGFPYFSEKHTSNIRPTVTKGNINNVNPAMIQTSCCVQSGFSGGAIMRMYREIGEPDLRCETVGIIVCNVKNDKNGVCHPHLNMAIPLKALKGRLENVISEPSVPKVNFAEERQSVQSLWRFDLSQSKL